MKPVIISVFLLSLSLSIAADRLCYQCHARNSETCKQEVIKCPKGEQCLTISEDYTYNGTFHSIWKGCSRNVPCNVKPYSKVTGEAYLMYNIKCCDEDLCNKKFYEMPPEEPPNGLECPSCIEKDTLEECKAKNKIMCRGDQDKCSNYAGVTKNPVDDVMSYSLQGCVSSLLCKFQLDQLVGVQVLNTSFLYCTTPPMDEEKGKT
ncbi:phospholipase A2 inhibitor gamma subunit A-like [Leptodactylus fuscus]|uniref:phospholipase A2 inhibitor gamma subunit A-like n=1 Tax=Leptodactylus fuscus TaxID=238119 RepID=UPI003F4E6AC7